MMPHRVFVTSPATESLVAFVTILQPLPGFLHLVEPLLGFLTIINPLLGLLLFSVALLGFLDSEAPSQIPALRAPKIFKMPAQNYSVSINATYLHIVYAHCGVFNVVHKWRVQVSHGRKIQILTCEKLVKMCKFNLCEANISIYNFLSLVPPDKRTLNPSWTAWYLRMRA